MPRKSWSKKAASTWKQGARPAVKWLEQQGGWSKIAGSLALVILIRCGLIAPLPAETPKTGRVEHIS